MHADTPISPGWRPSMANAIYGFPRRSDEPSPRRGGNPFISHQIHNKIPKIIALKTGSLPTGLTTLADAYRLQTPSGRQ